MKHWAALVLLASAYPAFASGYDDFTLGVNANVRGDSKQAIASFTAALAATDLAPAYLPVARRGRAAAYLSDDRCKEAKADLEIYAAQKPLDRSGLLMLAGAKMCLEDYSGAQQSFAAAMAVYPSGLAHWGFGRAQWEKGQFADAEANLRQAAELVDKKHNRTAYYVVLWYAIAADRIGKLDHAKLDDLVDDLSSGSDWPMPILKLYLGKYKPEEVAAKAGRGDDGAIAGQKCEADFYTAEWHIARGNPDAAKPLIASALAHCPKDFIEMSAARAEAGRLGVAIPKEGSP